jgi:uncharacterized protein (DUF433 family)
MAEIVKTDGVLGGKARLEGRRVSAFQIGEMYAQAGTSPEDIADQLDLDLAEVHAALSYYYEHPGEMESIRERERELESDLNTDSMAPEQV